MVFYQYLFDKSCFCKIIRKVATGVLSLLRKRQQYTGYYDMNADCGWWHAFAFISTPCYHHMVGSMMTSSNESIFRVTGPLCGEITGHRWIPPTKGQWRGIWIFSLICAWIKGWINNREAGYLRCHRAHYDVIVMRKFHTFCETHYMTWNRKHTCESTYLKRYRLICSIFTFIKYVFYNIYLKFHLKCVWRTWHLRKSAESYKARHLMNIVLLKYFMQTIYNSRKIWLWFTTY